VNHAKLYLIARYPRDASECYALGVKDSDHIFLTGVARWSRDPEKAVCFLTEKAATLHLRRMSWRWREVSEVLPVGLEVQAWEPA
jgi:hypothetical protein